MTVSAAELADLARTFHKRQGVPGLGVALVSLGSTVVVTSGVRRRGGQAVGEEDKWHIGSCAKAITAALYATLVQRGQAAWDTLVTVLFEGLNPEPLPAWRDITATDLLTHFAGLPANLTQAQNGGGLLQSGISYAPAWRGGAHVPGPAT